MLPRQIPPERTSTKLCATLTSGKCTMHPAVRHTLPTSRDNERNLGGDFPTPSCSIPCTEIISHLTRIIVILVISHLQDDVHHTKNDSVTNVSGSKVHHSIDIFQAADTDKISNATTTHLPQQKLPSHTGRSSLQTGALLNTKDRKYVHCRTTQRNLHKSERKTHQNEP